MDSPPPKTQPSSDIRKAILDAYTNLTRDQLALFLSIRHLPNDGSSIELANRLAQHDLEMYKSSPFLHSFPSPPEVMPEHPPAADIKHDPARILNLPAELIAEIMDHVGDWELAKAVGTTTALKRPRDWTRASLVDEAALSGSLVRMRLAVSPSEPSSSTSLLSTPLSTLTQVGANAIVRLGYVHILEHLRSQDRPTFDRLYGGKHYQVIPLRASASGRTDVLTWWRSRSDIPKKYGIECIDEACRHGQLDSLNWWWANSAPDHSHPYLKSANLSLPKHPDPTSSSSSSVSPPLAMLYTEAALENASAQGHVHVLCWWKQKNQQHGLPLRVGRVMDLASKHGNVDVLEWWRRSGVDVKCDHVSLEHASRSGKVDVLSWWLRSGYPLMANDEVLLGATRHNRPEVLQWWYDSGVEVHYRICDIEEALEDAIRPGPEAREWWSKLGVDFQATNTEWMKQKTLRH